MTAKRKEVTPLLEEIIERAGPGPSSAPCIGRIDGADDHGRILVSYGQVKRAAARYVAPLTRYELTADSRRGAEVLLNFEQGDANKPVIVALMADPVEELVSLAVDEKPTDVQVDGRTLAFEAQDEIILKCGPGTIHMTKEGKIILKGIEIVTRAKEANKIKGGKVEVN